MTDVMNYLRKKNIIIKREVVKMNKGLVFIGIILFIVLQVICILNIEPKEYTRRIHNIHNK